MSSEPNAPTPQCALHPRSQMCPLLHVHPLFNGDAQSTVGVAPLDMEVGTKVRTYLSFPTQTTKSPESSTCCSRVGGTMPDTHPLFSSPTAGTHVLGVIEE